MTKLKVRNWQAESFKKIDDCINSNQNELVSMPACVGSGKTLVMAYAFGKFILENKNEKTIQMFVSPRIKLCAQQVEELSDKIFELFGIKPIHDYKIIPVDCQHQDFDKKNKNLENQTNHSIFVICDASLWGEDPDAKKAEKDTMIRYHRWMNHFAEWQKQGYKFGCICYDEAHNYSSNVEKMLPGGYY